MEIFNGTPAPVHPADYAARFVVRAATTAPSVHNTQPWRFVSRPSAVDLHTDATRALPVADADGREMVISCGAALFNLGLAVRHLGFTAGTSPLPDPERPDLLARVRWGRSARPARYEELLYRMMTRRHTHRGPFTTVPAPPSLIPELRKLVREERAGLVLIRDAARRDLLAELTRTAELAQRSDPGFATELARWTPGPGDPRRDGVPAGAYPEQPDGLEFATRDFALGAPWGFRSRAHPTDSRADGLIVVLTTSGDRRPDWLRAGQALQRLLLHARTRGVSAAIHTQPLELPDLRSRIQHEITGGAYPQMILRLGHPRDSRRTPRRPALETLIEAVNRAGPVRQRAGT